MRQIDKEYKPELELHLSHPRFEIHFMPTSSSWMKVGSWFAELTGKAVRHGGFSRVPDQIESIEEFIRTWNSDPKPIMSRA